LSAGTMQKREEEKGLKGLVVPDLHDGFS